MAYRKGGREKHTVDNMMALAAARGGRFVSETYLGSMKKHTWECAHGHRWDATAKSVNSGSWCPECAREPGKRGRK